MHLNTVMKRVINDPRSNPNGALENIAGIFNSNRNILGMMPHPERMVDNLISNSDGINLFSSLMNYKWKLQIKLLKIMVLNNRRI